MASPNQRADALRGHLLVKPGSTVHLADVDPNATFGYHKASADRKVARDLQRLTELQERIWAERRHRVLIVLQGIDAAGKEGTTILKFFLYIDRAEQLARFRARYEDSTKRWKFKVEDLEERKRWDDYIAAFQDAVSRCSTERAPWYVVPANHKWFRNLAVGEIVADTLEALKPAYPPRDDIPKNLTFS